MKISPPDKVQALKYSQKYAEDYKQLIKDRGEEYHILTGSPYFLPKNLSDSAKTLCKKYRICYPVDPEEPFHEWEVEFIYPTITYLDNPESWHEVENIDLTGNIAEKLIRKVNGKLVIMVDTSFSKNKIHQSFKNLLDMELLESANKKKGRTKDSVIDNIWEIYRLKVLEEKNYLQIVRDKFGVDTHPAYDKTADSKQQVKRAHKKALRIIEHIELAASD